MANTSNTTVTWSVNSVTGGATAIGTITPDGVYTAPADLPSTAGSSGGPGASAVAVQVTARSEADTTKSASSNVTVASDVVIALSPNAVAVELGRLKVKRIGIWGRSLAGFLSICTAPGAQGYAFHEIVPDVRQPVSISGGSACPVRSHQRSAPGGIVVRWSTALATNPVTILTQDQTPNSRLNEIEQTILQSLAVWTGVSGTSLAASSVAPLTRVAGANSCGLDGVNSICFDQADAAFTPGVLAFTRVITADKISAQIGSGAAATEIGQILDADIYFDASDSQITFATPAAWSANPRAYNLESLLTHELGHFLGFSHSAVWRAMMYPYAPPARLAARDLRRSNRMHPSRKMTERDCECSIPALPTLYTRDRLADESCRQIQFRSQRRRLPA